MFIGRLKENSKKVTSLSPNRKEYFILFSKLGFSDELIELEKQGDVILFSVS